MKRVPTVNDAESVCTRLKELASLNFYDMLEHMEKVGPGLRYSAIDDHMCTYDRFSCDCWRSHWQCELSHARVTCSCYARPNSRCECGVHIHIKGKISWVAYWVDYHGNLHNSMDRPARIYSSGRREWWWRGRKHREHGPAILHRDGTEEYWQRGFRHRLQGPCRVDSTFTRAQSSVSPPWRYRGRVVTMDLAHPVAKKVALSYVFVLCGANRESLFALLFRHNMEHVIIIIIGEVLGDTLSQLHADALGIGDYVEILRRASKRPALVE
jgi:hypothetical protein